MSCTHASRRARAAASRFLTRPPHRLSSRSPSVRRRARRFERASRGFAVLARGRAGANERDRAVRIRSDGANARGDRGAGERARAIVREGYRVNGYCSGD